MSGFVSCRDDNESGGMLRRGSEVNEFGQMMVEKSGQDFGKHVFHAGIGLATLIRNGHWKKFIPAKETESEDGTRGFEHIHSMSHEKGSVVEHETIDSFIQAPKPKGLGGTKGLERHLSLLPESEANAVRLALAEAKCKSISEVRSEAIRKRWDKRAGIETSPEKIVSPQRKSKLEWTISRLTSLGRHDTIEKLRAGEITLKDVQRELGWVKPRVEVTPATTAAGAMRAIALMCYQERVNLLALLRAELDSMCDDDPDDDPEDDPDGTDDTGDEAKADQYALKPAEMPPKRTAAKGRSPYPVPLCGRKYDGSREWEGHEVDDDLMRICRERGESGVNFLGAHNTRQWKLVASRVGPANGNPAYDPYRQAHNEGLKLTLEQ